MKKPESVVERTSDLKVNKGDFVIERKGNFSDFYKSGEELG